MAAVFKPDRLQHRFRLAFNIRRLLFANQQRHRHVFQCAKVRQQMVELIDKAQLAVTQVGARGGG